MRTFPGPTRRTVLLGLAVGALAGCTDPAPPLPPDPLAALADRAFADAAMAGAIAATLPDLAAKAKEVTLARGDHMSVLLAEVERERPPVSSSVSPAPTFTQPTPPADPEVALATLLDGLTAAEEQAAALVGSLPRYRAGLVGSVAAACASLREVL